MGCQDNPLPIGGWAICGLEAAARFAIAIDDELYEWSEEELGRIEAVTQRLSRIQMRSNWIPGPSSYLPTTP